MGHSDQRPLEVCTPTLFMLSHISLSEHPPMGQRWGVVKSLGGYTSTECPIQAGHHGTLIVSLGGGECPRYTGHYGKGRTNHIHPGFHPGVMTTVSVPSSETPIGGQRDTDSLEGLRGSFPTAPAPTRKRGDLTRFIAPCFNLVKWQNSFQKRLSFTIPLPRILEPSPGGQSENTTQRRCIGLMLVIT